MPGLRLLSILVACLAAGPGCSTIASREMNADGVRLFEQSRYPEAIRQFERAIDANPSDADGYYNLAAAYHRQGAFSGRTTELAQAERYYNLCLDRNPEHRECHRGLTVLLAQQGRTEEAFRRLQELERPEPGFDRRQDRIGPVERRIRRPGGGPAIPGRGAPNRPEQ